MALTMWGSRVRIISTHNGIENLFNVLIIESRAGKGVSAYIASILNWLLVRAYFVVFVRSPRRPGARSCRTSGCATCYETVPPKKTPGRNTTASPRAAAAPISAVACVNGPPVVMAPVLRFTGSAAFNAASESERNAEMQEWLEAEVFPN